MGRRHRLDGLRRFVGDDGGRFRRDDLGLVGDDPDDRRRGYRLGRNFGLGRLGCRLLRGLLRLRLGRLHLDDRFAPKTFGVGKAPHAVRERIIDARRMALDADLQALAQIEHNLILDAELSRQLVNPDLLGGQASLLLVISRYVLTSFARKSARSSLFISVRNARATERLLIARSKHSTG